MGAESIRDAVRRQALDEAERSFATVAQAGASDALNAVIDYLIEGEEKHFIEAGAPENHIYRAVYHLARHAARKELKLFLDPDDKEAVADRIR